jgi:hypothetical protein
MEQVNAEALAALAEKAINGYIFIHGGCLKKILKQPLLTILYE